MGRGCSWGRSRSRGRGRGAARSPHALPPPRPPCGQRQDGQRVPASWAPRPERGCSGDEPRSPQPRPRRPSAGGCLRAAALLRPHCRARGALARPPREAPPPPGPGVARGGPKGAGEVASPRREPRPWRCGGSGAAPGARGVLTGGCGQGAACIRLRGAAGCLPRSVTRLVVVVTRCLGDLCSGWARVSPLDLVAIQLRIV